jgi:hypothetical protein
MQGIDEECAAELPFKATCYLPANDPREVKLSDFGWQVRERFLYVNRIFL